MEFTRVLLKPEVPLSAVDQLGARTDEWKLIDFTPYWEDKPYYKTWASTDRHTSIQYVQHPPRGVRYYSVTGTNREHHAAIIRDRLATYTREEIDAMMGNARTPAEKIAAAYHAAVLAPPQGDARIFAYLTQALTDSEPEVRRGAIDATRLAQWRDLQDPLERIAAEDSEAGLREFAKETLEVLHSKIWNTAG
jgi:hypothetical protein